MLCLRSTSVSFEGGGEVSGLEPADARSSFPAGAGQGLPHFLVTKVRRF